MKSSLLFRRRRWVLAALLVPALTFNPVNPLLHLDAQTPPPAPSGLAAPASTETDKETGKPITTTASGLKYVDLTVGTGAAIKEGDEVVAKYTGMFPDGTVFDASDKHEPPSITYVQGARGLIPGWIEGSSTMKIGGKRKLIIPPNLGYGADGNSVIPPNSTLIFIIEIVSAKPAPAQ